MVRRRRYPRAVRATHGSLTPGDLVLVYEVFDEDEVEWVKHDGCALVVHVEPTMMSMQESDPKYRLVTVLVDGRVVDDYYENELTPL